jgi:indolepyruvate ferredoxin oxidoreductase alpha subunit
MGIPNIHVIDPLQDPERLRQVVVESLAKPELTLIVARRNCLLAAGSIKAYERAIAPGGELEKCV